MKRKPLPNMPYGQTRLTYCPANTAGVAKMRLTCMAVSPHPPGAEGWSV